MRKHKTPGTLSLRSNLTHTFLAAVRNFPKILSDKIQLTKINGTKLFKWVLLDTAHLTPLEKNAPDTIVVKKKPNRNMPTSPPTDSEFPPDFLYYHSSCVRLT